MAETQVLPEEQKSPLAEGRELKLVDPDDALDFVESPLAEGRELKCSPRGRAGQLRGRPSRRGVN